MGDSKLASTFGVPLDYEWRGDHCAISLEEFETLARQKVGNQRVLRLLGSKLGRPLYVTNGQLYFEVPANPLRGVPGNAEHRSTPAIENRPGCPTEATLEEGNGEFEPTAFASRVTTPAKDDAPSLGPLAAAAPNAVIDHELLHARLRACPDQVRIDGVAINWGGMASPTPPKEPAHAPAPVDLERIGVETLLRTTGGGLYRGATPEQARDIDVGATVVIDRGECRRSLVAGAEAIRLQQEFDWAPPVSPAAPT